MTNLTVNKENNDSFVTIRNNGIYIGMRNSFSEAYQSINFNQWNSLELKNLKK